MDKGLSIGILRRITFSLMPVMTLKLEILVLVCFGNYIFLWSDLKGNIKFSYAWKMFNERCIWSDFDYCYVRVEKPFLVRVGKGHIPVQTIFFKS